MQFAFDPPQPVSVPVAGGDQRFPVHRVYCVAKNYAAHAREMGEDPERVPPAFFLKPADAVVAAAGDVAYPPATSNLHHEVELVAALGAGGSNVDVCNARDMIFGYAVGIDLTRRDLQQEARAVGGPWDTGKSFEQAAPISHLCPIERTGYLESGRIWLEVNGGIRQDGDISAMIWNTAEVISRLSGLFELRPGDLIFTGTPEGVGAIVPGDHLRGGIDGVAEFSLHIRG
jgi:fumarylpyruvate hydrolase